MNDETRNRIVYLHSQKTSKAAIGREVGVSRRTVGRVLDRVRQEREQPTSAPAHAKRVSERGSLLDPFVPLMRELFGRYPKITVVRMLEELKANGYAGGYTIVRQKMNELRPHPVRQPVVRFETAPGVQAQMDYATYDLDFTAEGRRRVHLFSYVLGYSRRQYLRFTVSQDFETTVREHLRAFEHLQGAASVCLYDNMKVVVTRWEDGEPIYNRRFLAFCTHYGFKPWACKPRRPRTKGKVERPFRYVESNLLNGRTFQSLEHLNEITTWWLANVADVRVHGETKKRPLDLHAEEQPHLLPLPAHPYDVDPVVYRTVDAAGFIPYERNLYSVPWRYIGAVVPVRIREAELVIYSPKLDEIARHDRMDRQTVGGKSEDPAHRPRENSREQLETLYARFAEIGPGAKRFLDQLLKRHRHGKSQARQILALLATYHVKDLRSALERALRFGAFHFKSIERILAVGAKPKSLTDRLADEGREHLGPLLAGESVSPRPTGDYQSLFEEETDDGETPDKETNTSKEIDDKEIDNGEANNRDESTDEEAGSGGPEA